MADLTNSLAIRNNSEALTMNAGAASQTIVITGGPDEKFIIVAKNYDAAVDCILRLSAGVHSDSGIGALDSETITHSVDYLNFFTFGPFEGSRFKNASGKLTLEVLDTDGTAYSGTVTKVVLGVIQLP